MGYLERDDTYGENQLAVGSNSTHGRMAKVGQLPSQEWPRLLECHPKLDSQQDFINHMHEDQDPLFDVSRFAKVRTIFQHSSRRTEGTCNLCKRECGNLKHHIARHLQQMALFALPRVNETAGSGEAEHRTVSSKSTAKDTGNEPNEDDEHRSSDAASEATGELGHEREYDPLHSQGHELVTSWPDALQTLEGHRGLVSAVAFSPNGKTLASSSCDQTVKLWDTGSGAVLQMLEGHSDFVNAVAFLAKRQDPSVGFVRLDGQAMGYKFGRSTTESRRLFRDCYRCSLLARRQNASVGFARSNGQAMGFRF